MKPYRPCNGSEGEWFNNRFCYQCERDRPYREDRGDSCEIFANALCFGIDEPGYPKEWVEDDDGSNPRCTAFEPEMNAFWIVPPPALAAGTRSAETSETSAPSEGCQSGPKGNAQRKSA